MSLTGRIIEEQKIHYVVDTASGMVTVTPSGKIRERHTGLCVGDLVDIAVTDTDANEGVVLRRHKRRNRFPRPAIANMDQMVLVNTYKEPTLELELLDRALVNAEWLGLSSLIVLNKIDLLDRGEDSALMRVENTYATIGYRCIRTCATTGENVEQMIKHCRGLASALVGPSGVGKSTLLSKVFPDYEFRVAGLSQKVDRGKHTTTSTRLLPLPEGGHIADTPGLSFLGLPDAPEDALAGLFPEIKSVLEGCRFADCAHLDEPGCAVVEAVACGRISESRYANYLSFHREAKSNRKTYRASRATQRRKQRLVDIARDLDEEVYDLGEEDEE